MALSPEMQALHDRWEVNHIQSDEKAQRECAERMEREFEKVWKYDQRHYKSQRKIDEEERDDFRSWFIDYAEEYN